MTRVFIKNKEDFTCEKCEAVVIGDGYTNHCPECLYSKHVDNAPGDRASICKGRMKPIRIEGTQKKYLITHICEKCNLRKKNTVGPKDNFDAVAKVARDSANQKKD